MCLPARARARVGRLSGPASSPECLSASGAPARPFAAGFRWSRLVPTSDSLPRLSLSQLAHAGWLFRVSLILVLAGRTTRTIGPKHAKSTQRPLLQPSQGPQGRVGCRKTEMRVPKASNTQVLSKRRARRSKTSLQTVGGGKPSPGGVGF